MKTKQGRKHIRGLGVLLLLFIMGAALLYLRGEIGMGTRETGGSLISSFLSRRAVDLPEPLRELAEKNPDAHGFVSQYDALSKLTYSAEAVDLGDAFVPGEIPHLMQWDLRWGYAPYGSQIMGLSGCGPTCLSMVTIGLTGDLRANPLAVADYSDSQGWYVEDAGTSWELMRSGATHYGLLWRELPLDLDTMIQALDSGEILILSLLPGDFTDFGHFVVVSAYGTEGFMVLDPNSYARSRYWSYSDLCGQIANIWAYSV